MGYAINSRQAAAGGRSRRLSAWPIVVVAIVGSTLGAGVTRGEEPGPGTPQTPMLPTWEGGRCEQCHEVDPLFSHPVGISPSMATPDGLPLVSGRITCLTCHDGSSSTLHVQARLDNTDLLRGSLRGAAFCQQCHDPLSLSREDQHGANLARAHVQRPDTVDMNGTPDPWAENRDDDPFPLDSARCLSCHDGSVATDVSHRLGFGSRRNRGQSMGFGDGHPISIEYPNRYSEYGLGEPYVIVEQLDSRIRIFDDRIECSSCHGMYAPNDHLLVISNERSNLCLSCHDL